MIRFPRSIQSIAWCLFYCVSTAVVLCLTAIAQESAIAPETLAAQETVIAQESAIAPETLVAQETAIAQESAIAQDSATVQESTITQEGVSSAALGADEVIARVVAMNQARARALATYTSVRTYHLECHCVVPKKADMVVRANYNSPNEKEFSILSESGSGAVRNKVFRQLLKAEQESMQEQNERRSAITPDNYTFRLVKYEKTDVNEVYVLEARPRSKNKFLFRGRLWVDAKEFAITRVEGQPAVNPSWWTTRTDFTRTYEKVGGFWLPKSNDSVTKVRIFGTGVLTIKYGDYQVTHAPDALVQSSEKKALN